MRSLLPSSQEQCEEVRESSSRKNTAHIKIAQNAGKETRRSTRLETMMKSGTMSAESSVSAESKESIDIMRSVGHIASKRSEVMPPIATDTHFSALNYFVEIYNYFSTFAPLRPQHFNEISSRNVGCSLQDIASVLWPENLKK